VAFDCRLWGALPSVAPWRLSVVITDACNMGTPRSW
jgi:hypothetical protein